MQIIIPMAGSGQRFLDAGYKDPKPLIKFDGRPMIERIVKIFTGETNFTFICNTDHLANTDMASVLKTIAPDCRIIGIAPHKKGPVYTVSQIFDQIDDKDEVIIQYCDVSKYWDYADFLKHTRERDADGAMSCNLGFHPHMLAGNCYALIDADKQWMNKITEKKPLDDINAEYVSDGAYYFKNGAIVKKYFQALMDKDMNVNGEYYASVPFNLMKDDGLNISVYEIQHMLSMQTPADLEEYHRWSSFFQLIIDQDNVFPPEKNSVNLIPLAGRGSRFADNGYKMPKPLIEVGGKPMIIQASESLPPAEKRVFVCLADHLKQYPLEEEIKKTYPDAEVISLDHVTEGQACTIEIGLKNVDPEAPVMIGACDYGALWDATKYQKLLNDKKIDAIVWTFRHHPNSKAHPEMYGWLKVDSKDNVKAMSVKVPVSDDPFNDHAFTGAMYFRKARYFMDALNELYKNGTRVKGEFYLDSCINELVKAKKTVKVFEVDHFAGWGTPDELKTYEYWQSFFHKCDWHPYSLEKDPSINKQVVKKLDRKYRKFSQKHR